MASTEMVMDVNLFVEEIKVVSIQPGDKLVIHVAEKLSYEQIARVKSEVSKWSDAPVLILDSGMRLDVLRKENGQAAQTQESIEATA